MIKYYLYRYVLEHLAPFIQSTPISKADWHDNNLALAQTISLLASHTEGNVLRKKVKTVNHDFGSLAQISFSHNELILTFAAETILAQHVFKMNFNENIVFNSSLSSAPDNHKNYYANMHLYADEERESFINLLSRLNKVNQETIVVSNGSSECIYHYYRAIKQLYGYHTIISFNPTFDYQLFYGDNHNQDEGFEEIKIPLAGNFGYNYKALEEAVISHPKSTVYLCNPNNPTGLMEDTTEILRLVQKYPETFFLIDEAYAEFDDQHVSVLAEVKNLSNLAVTKTFSKFYGMAGLRLGYLIANKAIVELISSFNSLVNPNIMACEIAIDMLNRPSLYDEIYQRNKDNIALVEHYLDDKGLRYLKSAANFVFVYLGGQYEGLVDYLMAHQILPARSFPAMLGWMRVSLVDRLSTGYFLYLLDDYLQHQALLLKA
ncbi:MAG: aminotransferase class I/II-fold pyridoxal phosphate-dependent enzyme [Psychrobacter sp.]|nr:aminotransferase class I/II-fold pyridoxal phosphate-dependent enzyme [Psychrobacter sp.]